MQFFDLSRHNLIAIDTETTGLRAKADRAFGLSVATEGHSGYWDLRQYPRALEWLREASRRPGVTIVAHNMSFDYKMLAAVGLELPMDKLDDTVIRACLIDENLNSYALDDLARKYLGERKTAEIYDQLAALFGGRATRNVQMRNIAQAPPEVVAPYAIKDAELVLKLYKWQSREIRRQGIEEIVAFERRVMPSLMRMEMHGMRVDCDVARAAQDGLTVQIDQMQSELNGLAGFDVNVNSAPQIRKVFNTVKLEGHWVTDSGVRVPETAGGAPSMGSEVLREMESDRRAELVLNIRSMLKTRDTFLGVHVLEHEYRGRVYPSINQTKGETAGTSTGRLSYTNPAMQQIPSRNKAVARIVKPVFLPEDGQYWLDADLASNEVRIFAHLVNNPVINALYADNLGTDFHQAVADLTGLPRNAAYSGQANAKQLNLSMIFNSGNGAIADKIGLPWEWNSFTTEDGEVVTYKKAGPEATAIIANYHEKLPGVKELAAKASRIAAGRGYIRTKYGRRLRFPDKRFAYKASGLLIQATAADINKQIIYRFENLANDLGGALLLNTHDSYSLSLPPDQIERFWSAGTDVLRDDFPWLNVPLMLELSGVGLNWWKALENQLDYKLG